MAVARACVPFSAAALVSSRCVPYSAVCCWPVSTLAWTRNTQQAAGVEGPNGLGPSGVWLSSSLRASCTRAACCESPGIRLVVATRKPPGALATASTLELLPPAWGGCGWVGRRCGAGVLVHWLAAKATNRMAGQKVVQVSCANCSRRQLLTGQGGVEGGQEGCPHGSVKRARQACDEANESNAGALCTWAEGRWYF